MSVCNAKQANTNPFNNLSAKSGRPCPDKVKAIRFNPNNGVIEMMYEHFICPALADFNKAFMKAMNMECNKPFGTDRGNYWYSDSTYAYIGM